MSSLRAMIVFFDRQKAAPLRAVLLPALVLRFADAKDQAKYAGEELRASDDYDFHKYRLLLT